MLLGSAGADPRRAHGSWAEGDRASGLALATGGGAGAGPRARGHLPRRAGSLSRKHSARPGQGGGGPKPRVPGCNRGLGLDKGVREGSFAVPRALSRRTRVRLRRQQPQRNRERSHESSLIHNVLPPGCAALPQAEATGPTSHELKPPNSLVLCKSISSLTGSACDSWCGHELGARGTVSGRVLPTGPAVEGKHVSFHRRTLHHALGSLCLAAQPLCRAWK
ncbi:uncharacterized protein LOC110345147 [Heterocephalus glaber]|uniref:Uncharacterized protein LOC110345147 n=1 Tax=Heterocephalus glaber TaxID=10181 RepID=A0AAX6RN01_HETGA|nr:uncharacterized protein LOC110345147 [Heterocephalus glaber]